MFKATGALRLSHKYLHSGGKQHCRCKSVVHSLSCWRRSVAVLFSHHTVRLRYGYGSYEVLHVDVQFHGDDPVNCSVSFEETNFQLRRRIQWLIQDLWRWVAKNFLINWGERRAWVSPTLACGSCVYVCLRPYTVNCKWAYLNISWRPNMPAICPARSRVGEGLLPESSVSVKPEERRRFKLTKRHTEVMSWISRAYECRLCMA